MKKNIFLILIFFSFNLFANVPINNQSFWCTTADNTIFHLQTDTYFNCLLVNLHTAEKYTGSYKFDGEVLSFYFPAFNFEETSTTIEHGEGYIFNFETVSLKCYGIMN